MAWALTRVPATHGAVMLAVLPLATAAVARLRAGEQPPWLFWLAGGLASATIAAYALLTARPGAHGGLHAADAALIGAVVLAAWGYGEGGRLARTLGGWRVISWALVLALPVTAGPVAWAVLHLRLRAVPPAAWASFAYLALGSQLTAFFAWYHGLAVGGVARVSQLQYLQVFLTLLWSAWWLHEPVTPLTVVAALLVMAGVVVGQWTTASAGGSSVFSSGSPSPGPR